METKMANNSAEASRENFWSILNNKKYTISIPRIQRDYAQGRKEPEPTQIRQTFLKDAFNSLTNNVPMDINFIYGNLDKNEDGIEKFIPIDGQQRLTTLFLMHWYFAMWSRKMTDENKEILGRFQYETRFVTGDFCKRLVDDVSVDLKELTRSDKTLISVIKDYYWFFSVYENDATIKSMLVMLQEIHDMVKNIEDITIVDDFFDIMISEDGPISFLFLNIADVGLTDEIYIKMNARGKALTRFENFKAQLTAYLSNYDNDFSQEFIGNINGVWSQFFWNKEYRPNVEIKDENGKTNKKSIIFDDQIMNLFRFIMMNEYINNIELDDTSSETKYLIRSLLGALSKENDFQFVNHLFTDEFRNVYQYKSENANVDEKVFKFINKLLNVLSKRKVETGSIKFVDSSLYGQVYLNEENYFKRLIRSVNEKPLSYEDQILYYAELCFLVKYANADDSFDKTAEITEWIRFIYNLTRNTLYNGYDDYYRSIRSVRKIIDGGFADNILDYAATLLRREYKAGTGYGFVENQMMEECIKANLLIRGGAWKKCIIEAEKSFLGSQIAAILSFSGIWKMYEDAMMDYEGKNPDGWKLPYVKCILNRAEEVPEYISSFELYLKKFNLIFDKDDLKSELNNDSILRRALLTYGGADSYMLPAGKPVCCFLDSTDRDTSFRRLFRGDSPASRGYFKQLLDDMDANKDVVEQLKVIIGNMSYDDNNRLKRYFIEMPEILDCMYQNKGKTDPAGKFVFQSGKRYICKRNADQILLLEKTKTSSTNREYYSYVLYLKAVNKGLKVEYFTTFSESAEKYLMYENNQNVEVHVLYMKDETTQKYKYFARSNGQILYKGNIDNMLDYIEQSIK